MSPSGAAEQKWISQGKYVFMLNNLVLKQVPFFVFCLWFLESRANWSLSQLTQGERLDTHWTPASVCLSLIHIMKSAAKLKKLYAKASLKWNDSTLEKSRR